MNEQAIKNDDGKNPLYLLPFESLEQIGLVLKHGAKKYSAHNWRGGLSYSRLISAMLRHIFAWIRGEENDTESGLHHLAHAGCELLFLLSYRTIGGGIDDRQFTNQEVMCGIDPAKEPPSYYSINDDKEVNRIREYKNSMMSRIKACPRCESSDIKPINTDYSQCQDCAFKFYTFSTQELKPGELL